MEYYLHFIASPTLFAACAGGSMGRCGVNYSKYYGGELSYLVGFS